MEFEEVGASDSAGRGDAGSEDEEMMEKVTEERVAAHASGSRLPADAQGGEEEEEEFEEVESADDGRYGGDEHQDGDEEDDEEEEQDMSADYAQLLGTDGASTSAGPSTSSKARSKGKGKASASDVSKGPRVYYDGKGQHAGVTISLDAENAANALQRRRNKEDEEKRRKRRENMITPRDRLNRINAHKLHVLALLAWCRRRNAQLQDDDLQVSLSPEFDATPQRRSGTHAHDATGMARDQVPKHLIQRQKQIHPKREPNQRERVRLFESFLTQLVSWWRGAFQLDPLLCAASAIRQPDADLMHGHFRSPGVRVDGWIYESAAERVEREKRERQEKNRWFKRLEKAKEAGIQKYEEAQARGATSSKGKGKRRGKGKERAIDLTNDDDISDSSSSAGKVPQALPSISLFPPGSASHTKPPAYLRLAKTVERTATPRDLLERALDWRGSRETSASLFASLCRSLGIPARLVISPQVPPWSVAAGKVGMTGADNVGDTTAAGEGASVGASARKRQAANGTLSVEEMQRRKASAMLTSDEDGEASARSGSGAARARRQVRRAPLSASGAVRKVRRKRGQ